MIWSVTQFPELQHLTEAQQRHVLRSLPRFFHARVALGAAVGGLAASILFVGGLGSQELINPMVNPMVTGVVLIVVAALVGCSIHLCLIALVRKSMRGHLVACFSGQRPPFCFHCGYDLREITEERCPECGKATRSDPPAAAKTATDAEAR